jgi:hypothetical protein
MNYFIFTITTIIIIIFIIIELYSKEKNSSLQIILPSSHLKYLSTIDYYITVMY